MNYLLGRYINAKYKHKIREVCSCPNCEKATIKKSQNHIFCTITCKDTFWLKIKGISSGAFRHGREPLYPGGYGQWKKDLYVEESNIAEKILLGESDD